jgi:hypothetical protein
MPTRSTHQKTRLLAPLFALLGAFAACGDPDSTPDVTGGMTASTGTGGSGGSAGSSTASGGEGGGGGAGGASPCDSATAACPCKLQGECGDGALCVDGLCITPCDFSYQCGGDKVCANGECVTKCDGAFPCEAGYKCTKGICVPDPASPQCGAGVPCPSGEMCVGGLCTTACSKNADCGPGEVCEWSSGSCIEDPSAQPVCTMTAECKSVIPQVCGQDGFCHFVCDPATVDMGVGQCKSIDSRFVKCDNGVCKTQEEVSPECTTQQPCKEVGKDCISNKCI